MNIDILKECIRVEVIGRDHKFSWRKALTRTRHNRRKYFMFWWRVACYLYAKGGFKRRFARRIEEKLHRQYDVEIPLTVTIGPGLNLAHLSGIAITENCIIGKNLHIKQGVTIGLRTPAAQALIQIGDKVDIGCNSSILGGKITIGDNVTVGAHALVTKSIPPDSVYINQITPLIKQKCRAL
ncbi:serine acetyltransferase [Escherichia sp. E1130]|uniref:serine O-acetyltransferase n=1 Tax=Escherichia sp. E1130 TaxID=2041645 RepID=UPI0010805493|nr:serine acetyltransferase [Escherichia sp. E1130]TGC28856.1 transferase [Escherichia sp. E1130]TLI70123.1 serine acetyltransferase [Escherichia sp. E1130]